MTLQTAGEAAAELVKLAAWIEAQLASETASRQGTAKESLARIKDIVFDLDAAGYAPAAPAAPPAGSAAAYAASHRVLCAHAAGRPGAHWLEPGERCPDAQPRPAAAPLETERQARELPAV
ncbi:MAG: hypothetical protein ACHP9Z_31730, partial [Streptosporangiales bacterium]